MPILSLQVTDLDKESRTKIHRWISTFDKLSSETVDKDGDKYIKIIPMTGGCGVQQEIIYKRQLIIYLYLFQETIDYTVVPPPVRVTPTAHFIRRVWKRRKLLDSYPPNSSRQN